jgi:DNA-binding MarR family transcriptional regulator
MTGHHPCEGLRSGSDARLLSFTTLMVSEVTLTPEAVAADLRPVLLRLARELRKETEQLGITARQATFLWLVKRSPGLSLAELAAEEGISPPAMSGHVDRLERAGLLARERSSADRRRVGLRLTEEGERLMRRIRARRTTWLADRLRTLEPAELEAVETAVPALLRLVEHES